LKRRPDYIRGGFHLTDEVNLSTEECLAYFSVVHISTPFPTFLTDFLFATEMFPFISAPVDYTSSPFTPISRRRCFQAAYDENFTPGNKSSFLSFFGLRWRAGTI